MPTSGEYRQSFCWWNSRYREKSLHRFAEYRAPGPHFPPESNEIQRQAIYSRPDPNISWEPHRHPARHRTSRKIPVVAQPAHGLVRPRRGPERVPARVPAQIVRRPRPPKAEVLLLLSSHSLLHIRKTFILKFPFV